MYGGSSLPSIIVRLKQASNPTAVHHPAAWEPGRLPEAAVVGGAPSPAHLGLSCPPAAWQEPASPGHPHLPPLHQAGTMPPGQAVQLLSARPFPPILAPQPPPTDAPFP